MSEDHALNITWCITFVKPFSEVSRK